MATVEEISGCVKCYIWDVVLPESHLNDSVDPNLDQLVTIPPLLPTS